MRSILKRILQTFMVLFFLLLIFRGPVYRYSVKYKDIGNRNIYQITDLGFNKKIDSLAQDFKIDAKTIVAIANKITIEYLSFTNNVAPRNPNNLIIQKKANCIGYSAVFNSVANYLIQKHNLQE